MANPLIKTKLIAHTEGFTMDMHPGPALHNLYGMRSVSSAMTCPVAEDQSGSEASSYPGWSLAGSG